ncbi:MAG: hypothetical protein BTN85_1751 [Candidatus Methanohalarchaeum thermophilum]|uniref:Uncharacterized protein n=1 Tax=Methanohalarchaeum thermophilum TaxID=1903181 RepID=A0A1Q6DRV9_METT1|nr:MAG: hypothetical protein BTN85_1751 [Candidatus Methanohalarchaeum thermophilum]
MRLHWKLFLFPLRTDMSKNRRHFTTVNYFYLKQRSRKSFFRFPRDGDVNITVSKIVAKNLNLKKEIGELKDVFCPN